MGSFAAGRECTGSRRFNSLTDYLVSWDKRFGLVALSHYFKDFIHIDYHDLLGLLLKLH